ncbi:MAG TPA: HipA domain-containing protein [Cytophagaceae bacterium]|jgi:serine/threonine-protein kinase HipA|nr:HipA domain-containing protein [Cytophagaceae bacterium]
MILDRCPSTLKSGYDSYSPSALKKLFNGKKVSHILPFLSPEKDEHTRELFMDNRERLSISGVQNKISLVLQKNKLRLNKFQEDGQYILKPIPSDVKKTDQVPANEHLTMQLAEQIFNIYTAANGLIFFQDGQPAYITKRFDIKLDGTKYLIDDFTSLTKKSAIRSGPDFKYEGSVELLFQTLKKFVGAYKIESVKLFRIVLFNYVFSNGDAHLKNYSLMQTDDGDYILSPAYDLFCTRLHVDDSDIAFTNGLFEADYETESYKANGYFAYDDFFELGIKTGLSESIIKHEIQLFSASEKEIESLVGRSFLNNDMKAGYLELYRDKLKRLRYSFLGMV